jgi:tRNA-binding protein
MNPAPIKPTVPFAALEALDIRVGTIERVEEVPKSNKLLRLVVNFGDHQRTILSGIKQERPDPQEIVGRQALFVVNLEPRKMAGEVSEGMLFDLGFAMASRPPWRSRSGRCRMGRGRGRCYAAWLDLARSYNVSGAMSAPFGHATVPPSRKKRAK